GDSGGAAAPSHGPKTAIPVLTGDEIVTVTQGRCTRAHKIIRATSDEAIRGGDGAPNADSAASPGCRSTAAVPVRAQNHVIAITQDADASADAIGGKRRAWIGTN